MARVKTTRKQIELLIPKRVLKQFKSTQKRFEILLRDKELPPPLRKYVNVMQKQLEKYAGKDLDKLKTFLESEKKVFGKYRKNIKKYVKNPIHELSKLLVKGQGGKPSNGKAKIIVPRSTAKLETTAPRSATKPKTTAPRSATKPKTTAPRSATKPKTTAPRSATKPKTAASSRTPQKEATQTAQTEVRQ